MWISNDGKFFRMASQKDSEEIPCDYVCYNNVYENSKNEPKQEASIFEGEYSDGDSNKDAEDTPDKLESTTGKKATPSRIKRRVSRYDENNYALPDSDDDAEIISVKAKLKANEAQSEAQKSRLIAWRITSFVSIFVLLISVTGNVYLAFERLSTTGKIFTTTCQK